MTRILLADDHQIFRDGLRRLLESEQDFTVCGEAADGAEAARQVRQLHPDLLLLDLSMPGADGLVALRQLAEEDVGPKTLLLTGAIEQTALVAAVELGARGVVMKDSSTALLLKAIRAVIAGEFWLGRERVSSLVDALRPSMYRSGAPRQDFSLTVRELLVVSGVVAAYTNREIAVGMSISEKTVKHHLTNVFDKTGVSSRMELAMFAVRHRLQLPDFPHH